ncbi:MAG TPA: nucleotidyl transferase AbiEii/AbiGii toxin family protein [Thermoanaerobaculia bacterium]|nr:nucleotidyl transferase AbiEii/AbiGii toxin family protein [Thermoanaerobaculia bacterium]
MRFDEVLRTFAEFFRQDGIRYAVAGGLAIHAWGRSRTTRDIDFVVDGSSQDRVIAFAESIGYRTLHASSGYSNHEHADEAFGIVDFMYVYGDTAERVFAEASQRIVAGDAAAPVPKPEHLIAMKVQAIKNAPRRVSIDVPDIEYLLKLPGVDRSVVRDYFERAGLLRIYDVISQDS